MLNVFKQGFYCSCIEKSQQNHCLIYKGVLLTPVLCNHQVNLSKIKHFVSYNAGYGGFCKLLSGLIWIKSHWPYNPGTSKHSHIVTQRATKRGPVTQFCVLAEISKIKNSINDQWVSTPPNRFQGKGLHTSWTDNKDQRNELTRKLSVKSKIFVEELSMRTLTAWWPECSCSTGAQRQSVLRL